MESIGDITLKGKCDLTDPWYGEDVWCRHTVNVKPGTYHCYALESDEGEWGNRVSDTWIIHEDSDNGEPPYIDMKLTETESFDCGVDSGLFGYFDNKPTLTDAEGDEIINISKYPLKYISQFSGRDGFLTSAGYGDGLYPVSVYKNKDGEVVAMSAQFI